MGLTRGVRAHALKPPGHSEELFFLLDSRVPPRVLSLTFASMCVTESAGRPVTDRGQRSEVSGGFGFRPNALRAVLALDAVRKQLPGKMSSLPFFFNKKEN